VAHACNPSYSGSRDQEDFGLNPAQANSSWDPITKKGWRPWVSTNPSTAKKKKKKKDKNQQLWEAEAGVSKFEASPQSSCLSLLGLDMYHHAQPRVVLK
jgi:hypothetical protein